ncbi:MAG: D-glycero-beta-D-manno-heptose-1,7-bisphosphate 7-phosphatase, partial [Solibacillus sp.]
MKRAVFLDRDGVINEVLTDRVKFVNEPNQFYFL